MDKVKGSMGLLSDVQITADMEGLDAESKTLLRNREILAVILQGVAEEYEGYSLREIMGMIEPVFLQRDISPGRTNTRFRGEGMQVYGEAHQACEESAQIHGENTEFIMLNEKTAVFDLSFKAKDPLLSTGDVQVSLHIDIEMQKKSRVPYPIEKRGLYYLARSLSAQLSLVTVETDYSQLEKCYSIWICRDDIPAEDRYSISFYGITNTKNIRSGTSTREDGLEKAVREGVTAKKDYDLMTLVVIRLGHKVYNGKKGDEGYDLLRFLNTIMYPHREGFMEILSEYVDFSKNEELWKEAEQMNGLGQSILEEGRAEGRAEGIQAMIMDNLEEQIPMEKIISKLQRHFGLTREKAEQYYEKALEGAMAVV